MWCRPSSTQLIPLTCFSSWTTHAAQRTLKLFNITLVEKYLKQHSIKNINNIMREAWFWDSSSGNIPLWNISMRFNSMKTKESWTSIMMDLCSLCFSSTSRSWKFLQLMEFLISSTSRRILATTRVMSYIKAQRTEKKIWVSLSTSGLTKTKDLWSGMETTR